MIPPLTPGGSEPAPAPPVDLWTRDIELLRQASGWARFLAVVGFVLTGLFGLALVGVTFAVIAGGMERTRLTFIFAPLVVVLAGTATASILVWSYGRNVLSFLVNGEPSLTRAFRNLRHFFKLSTLLLALTTIVKIVSLLGRLL